MEKLSSTTFNSTSVFRRASGRPSGRPSMFSNVPGHNGRQIPVIPKVVMLKDERNLRDKNVQTVLIKRIIEFLDNYGASAKFQYTEKMLRSPSANDFKQIFEFIFRYLEPNFTSVNIAEEV